MLRLSYPAAALSFAQTAVNPGLEPLRMLTGAWSTNHSNDGVEFRYDLGGQVIIGRAKPDVAGANWSEMIVVYTEGIGHEVKADSFDSREQVIHYQLAAANGKMVQFISPKFRLTYEKSGPAELSWSLETARPERPGEYTVRSSGFLERVMTVRPLSE